MRTVRKKNWDTPSIAYWFLLVYIIAALVWWFVSLVSQSETMALYREQQLRYTTDSTINKQEYARQLQAIREEKEREETKYIAEGATFMLVIFIGAF
ncbi:MAG TPA: hypothetical protein VD996_01650, partial [Chitinophagaceae bacterium]|nr:hypothetical protein [Chitinophagaceae bacterium]